jgi:CheY-like chemotaxis protein
MSGSGGRGSCLVLEDEAMVAMLMEDMLAELGYEARLASTVENALNEAVSGGFDCAILDVNLRGRRSYPVAEALLARGIPFAFVTGYGLEGVDPRFRDAAVLQKPFSTSDLQQVIQALEARR